VVGLAVGAGLRLDRAKWLTYTEPAVRARGGNADAERTGPGPGAWSHGPHAMVDWAWGGGGIG
jgi:hypothetical protein